MRQGYVLWMVCVVVIFCQSSCAPPAYVPNKIQAPLFSKQGQIYAEGAFSDPDWEAAAGYSVTSDLALIGAMKISPKKNFDTAEYTTQFFQAGAGYYKILSDHFLFESFGTIGLGKTESKGFNTLHKSIILFSDIISSDVDTFMHVSSRYVRYAIEGHIAF